LEQTAFALHQAGQTGRASPGDQGISFPMSELPSGVHGGGSHLDADPIGNLGLTLLPGEAFRLPPPVGSPEAGNELLTIRGLRMIDILVDGLVTDGQTGMVESDSARDDLRRPALTKLGHNVGPDSLLLEAEPLAGFPLPSLGPVLGAVGQVTTVGRGSIPAQFPRDRTGIPAQRRCNPVEALPLPMHFKDPLSFDQGEMMKVCSHNHLG